MKDPWYLAASLTQCSVSEIGLPPRSRSASETVQLYGRRFTIEETFRDTQDLHFGSGWHGSTLIGTDWYYV